MGIDMIKAWLADSLTRVFPLVPNGKAPAAPRQQQRLDLAKGEQGSVQLCYWFDGLKHAEAQIAVAMDQPGKSNKSNKSGSSIQVIAKRVGHVPVPQHNTVTPVDELDGVGYIPGYVPDVLWPDTAHVAAPLKVHAYWIDVHVPAQTKAGVYRVNASLSLSGEMVKTLGFDVHVADVLAQPRRDFPVTHWFYADALCDWYKLDPWEPAFWPLFEKYVAHYVSVGNDTLYVPVCTPPLDGVKRPTQLLDVKRTGKDRYTFDWSNVDQWIRRAKKQGVKKFEWTHLFSQWGVAHAIRIYEKRKGEDVLLWPADEPAAGPVYRKFLAQFLPEFKKYLTKRKLMDMSFFHISDEPSEKHLQAYKTARSLIVELAPWMKTIDALSHVEFAELVDMPVSVISSVMDFKKANVDCWCYFCCGPRDRYINRLLDTPLAKVRMTFWIAYALQMKGFLHWGYNYWHQCHQRNLIDPFTVSDGVKWPTWPHGDPFIVYPGPDGPLDSIRARVFAQSLQDFALLQTLNIDPKDKRLAKLENFKDFPRDHNWTTKLRRQLLGT